MMFEVNQKVVCIAHGTYRDFRNRGFKVPERGSIYTIRSIRADPCCDKIGLLFKELSNPIFKCSCCDNHFAEPAFAQDEFEPVTDISMLKKMLEPA